jgi:PTH1 family peptidyl-tRNA hydrolase
VRPRGLLSPSPLRVCVIGLGNPGPEYRDSRHNAGFRVLDSLAAALGLVFRRPFCHPYLRAPVRLSRGLGLLVKPLTYMNRSGRVLAPLGRGYSGLREGLILVCDNCDLPPGALRIKRGGSSAGQKGLQSIIDSLGTPDFFRVYVGIGRPEARGDLAAHVLSAPSGQERESLRAGEERAAAAVQALWEGEPDRVMGEYNRRQP